jgi:alpha-D-xyloside xylohydrolase
VGPVVQHSGQDSNQELEIRIYEGANGEFTLYEDEGDNYNYEKGQFRPFNSHGTMPKKS